MPHENPIEAALRALTDVEWNKRRDGSFEARINHTHLIGIQQMLEEYKIVVTGEISTQRSGRYMAHVGADQVAHILKAVEKTKATVKPHRRKWHS